MSVHTNKQANAISDALEERARAYRMSVPLLLETVGVKTSAFEPIQAGVFDDLNSEAIDCLMRLFVIIDIPTADPARLIQTDAAAMIQMMREWGRRNAADIIDAKHVLADRRIEVATFRAAEARRLIKRIDRLLAVDVVALLIGAAVAEVMPAWVSVIYSLSALGLAIAVVAFIAGFQLRVTVRSIG